MTTTSLEPVLNTEIAERMISVIDAEVALQEEHLHILMLQRDALISCDRQLFSSLHARFENLVNKLEMHAKRRKNDLPVNSEQLAEEMATWPQDMQDHARASIEHLKEIAEIIGTQAPQNQALINNDLKIITYGLSLMMESGKKGPHYVQTGASQVNSGNRLLNRVA
jgi:Mg2+ and Co2+ transporter CorA